MSSNDPLNPYAPPKASILEARRENDDELNLEGNRVSAGRGSAWFGEAWTMFKMDPGTWIGMWVVYMLMTFLLAIIPMGSLASSLLYGVFMGGVLLGCRDVESGAGLRFTHLFDGFKQSTAELVIIGLLYLIGVIIVVVAVVIVVVIGVSLMAVAGASGGFDIENPATWMAFIPMIFIGALLTMALIVPMVAAIWFAPALVVFHKVAPMAALKASFWGCMRNLLPFLVYGVVGILLAILAIIPLGLGFLVLGPMFWITIYTGYKDIFLRQA